MTSDTARLDWLEKYGGERVQDVYWRMENEACSARQAIDWFMKQEEKEKQ